MEEHLQKQGLMLTLLSMSDKAESKKKEELCRSTLSVETYMSVVKQERVLCTR